MTIRVALDHYNTRYRYKRPVHLRHMRCARAQLVFPEETTEFSVAVELVADLTAINLFDFFLDD